MKNTERINELQKYIKTLVDLQASGFNCKIEIQVAIKALHEAMGFGGLSTQKSQTIIILEKDFEGVIKSVETFSNLLSNVKISRFKKSDNHELKSDNISIMIINAYDIDSVKDVTKGMAFDYIINNSKFTTKSFDLQMR